VNLVEARAAIQAGNVAWGDARVGYDRDTFERMLAPAFYVRLPDRRLTRQEFIDLISTPPTGARLARFDASVLTVQPDGDSWIAIIVERIERVSTVAGGAPTRERILAVTRDGWKWEGDRWVVLFSELIGEERWPDAVIPPAREW
jgi:hypothetical protein